MHACNRTYQKNITRYQYFNCNSELRSNTQYLVSFKIVYSGRAAIVQKSPLTQTAMICQPKQRSLSSVLLFQTSSYLEAESGSEDPEVKNKTITPQIHTMKKKKKARKISPQSCPSLVDQPGHPAAKHLVLPISDGIMLLPFIDSRKCLVAGPVKPELSRRF